MKIKSLISVRTIFFAITFGIPVLLAVFKPFSFTIVQSLLLGVLLQCILCWATNLIDRSIVSAYLLVCFFFIGDAKPLQVFNFIFTPTVFFSRDAFFFSENFIFIISSFLLSTAITKSGLADRLALTTFVKFAKSPAGIVRFSFIAGTLLIFLIPQSFPRVIIMASLYLSFFNRIIISQKMKNALLFSIFVATTAGGVLFLNGDVGLNYAALGFAGTSLSYLEWIKYMFVPSLLLMGGAYFVFNRLYGIKDEAFVFLPKQAADAGPEIPAKLSPSEIKVIVTSSVLIVLWLTESLHGFAAAHSAGIIVIILFFLRVLDWRDFKVINLSLMLFLTAAFSIGRVLTINGIADVINTYVFRILPDAQSFFYYPAITLVIMVLHFILGSVVTTLSIAIPTLISFPQAEPVTMALLALSVVNMQYFLPLHHVTVLIGAGKGYYSQKETIKLGVCFFFIMILYIPFVLIQWWRIIL